MKITKQHKKQFESLTTVELKDYIREINQEQKKLAKRLYNYTKEISILQETNQELYYLIMGIISKRFETKKGKTPSINCNEDLK